MYLITGANGQLAQSFKKALGKDAYYVNKNQLDITDKHAVNEFIQDKPISTIINCAAYTKVDLAEDEKEQAERINIIGAENLAKTGIPIVHFSTDYVFNGEKNTPYKEGDATDPINFYGKTKLDSEIAVLNFAKNAIIIRVSWLYSEFGNNFLKTMCRLFSEKDSLNIVADQFGSPTYTGHLVYAVLKIIPQMNQSNKGIYHYCNEGKTSWYEFACNILKNTNYKCDLSPIDTSSYRTKAKRPKYSVLDTSKIKETFSIKIPNWQEGVIECLKNQSS